MKIALVTTTINVPKVLALYRKISADVRFFVVLDKKTPEEAVNFCEYDLPNTRVIYVEDQQKWKCSELIGWSCIQRRNIGFLEALAGGADIIATIDDDNIPLSSDYFNDFARTLHDSFAALRASSSSGWFDVGELLIPKASHRGFPHTHRAEPVFEPVIDVQVGVAAGICLGDPDIGAVTRIANAPTVHSVSELLRGGVVTDPRKTWTVFNSQNTAFRRELTPAMFLFPHCGRYDDIFASLVCQRVMAEKNLHVHFGHPFVWQQRNQHDLIKDLRAEIMGMEHVAAFANVLEHITLGQSDHYGHTILQALGAVPWFPAKAVEAGLAWMDDIESVL